MNLDKDRFDLVKNFLKDNDCELKLLEVHNNVTSVTVKLENGCLAEGYELTEICNSDLIAYMWRVFSC